MLSRHFSWKPFSLFLLFLLLLFFFSFLLAYRTLFQEFERKLKEKRSSLDALKGQDDATINRILEKSLGFADELDRLTIIAEIPRLYPLQPGTPPSSLLDHYAASWVLSDFFR